MDGEEESMAASERLLPLLLCGLSPAYDGGSGESSE